MKNEFKKSLLISIICIVLYSIAALLAILFNTTTLEMMVCMLVANYAKQICNDIIDD